MSFWNQVKSGLNKAASEAEKQANVARLSLQVNDVKSDIRRKTEALGEAALPLVRSGELTQPALTAVYQDIVALEAKVKDLEEQIARTKAGEETKGSEDAKPSEDAKASTDTPAAAAGS